MNDTLAVEKLTVSLGAAPILRDLSFRLSPGSATAVIGPNGAGKTVLFRALIGAVPYQGTIRWAPGTRIGYVPQKLDLERDLPLTGRDFLRAKQVVSGASTAEVEEALAAVSLSPGAVRSPIGTLSGGQFQRLVLAFALVGRPTVLLFDEPTAGVDEPGEERLYAMIQRVQAAQKLTLLVISHELSIVYRYTEQVLCLGHGTPFFGPPDEVLTPARIEQVYGAPLRYHLHR
jgi:zinc transport system ATP-binding protein